MFTKTLINVSSSFCNVIGEGIMVRSSQSSRTKNKEDSDDSKVAYDPDKTAINVSIYLSLTSLSSVISSYFGGYLIEALESNRKVFLVSSFLPILTFFAGLITAENSINSYSTSTQNSHCYSARLNLIRVFQCLK